MAIRLEPQHPLAYVNRAETLKLLGDKVAARASVTKALQLAPGFPPAVEVLKKLGEPKRSKEPSSEAAQEAYRRCTFPVTDLGPGEEGIKQIIKVCTLLVTAQGGSDANRALVHLQRGSMYRRQGDYQHALIDFSESLRYDPESALAYTGRGNAYRGLKLLDQALADHTEAIRLDPKYATAYNNRGNVWRDKNDLAKAIADFDRAIAISPNYAMAYFNRGNSRLESGDKEGAVADFQQTVKLSPQFKEAAERLQGTRREDVATPPTAWVNALAFVAFVAILGCCVSGAVCVAIQSDEPCHGP